MKACDLAVFVDSFDGMADVWPYYFAIFNKYWKDCSLHRYLVTNEMAFSEDNLEVIKTGKDRNWFEMTLKALSYVNEKYIFFMIDDDFMSEPADEKELEAIIKYMKKNDIFFYRFTCPKNFKKNCGYLKVYGDVIYPISIQPAIWRVDKLRSYLEEMKNDGCVTPWDFERYFIELYRNYDKKTVIPGILYDSRNLFGFTNGIIQGKWDPRIVRMYAKRGIVINIKPRGKMPFKRVVFDAVKRNPLIRSMSFEKQIKVKRFLKRIGFNFVTK